MTKSLKYIKSQRAEQDLVDILRYSYNLWGKQKAFDYLRKIERHFELLAENPKKGRIFEYKNKSYRKSLIKKHVIFYRASQSGIVIIRILHQSMDLTSHL